MAFQGTPKYGGYGSILNRLEWPYRGHLSLQQIVLIAMHTQMCTFLKVLAKICNIYILQTGQKNGLSYSVESFTVPFYMYVHLLIKMLLLKLNWLAMVIKTSLKFFINLCCTYTFDPKFQSLKKSILEIFHQLSPMRRVLCIGI